MSGTGLEGGKILGRLRQDAYTGTNRCWSCTILNSGILLVVSLTAGIFGSPPVGGITLLVGAVVIWLRGYLVPYTPRLTPRLLAALPGERGGHAPPPTPPESEASADTNGAIESEDTDATDDQIVSGVLDDLLVANVLQESDGELTLSPSFRTEWRTEIESNRPYDLEALADAMERTVSWVADASVVTDEGRSWIRLTDEHDSIRNETWLAPPAAIADLTAVRSLDARTNLSSDQKTLAAPSLRQFLDRCPTCDEKLEITSPRACCGSPRYVAEGIEAVLSCPACDEILATFEASEDAD